MGGTKITVLQGKFNPDLFELVQKPGNVVEPRRKVPNANRAPEVLEQGEIVSPAKQSNERDLNALVSFTVVVIQ